jgi:hypothetical protein
MEKAELARRWCAVVADGELGDDLDAPGQKEEANGSTGARQREEPGMVRGTGRVPWATLIRLKYIYNFLCSMLVYTPFALCFVTLRGVFMHFLELTY